MYLERPVFLTVFFAFVEIKGAKKQRGSTDMGVRLKRKSRLLLRELGMSVKMQPRLYSLVSMWCKLTSKRFWAVPDFSSCSVFRAYGKGS